MQGGGWWCRVGTSDTDNTAPLLHSALPFLPTQYTGFPPARHTSGTHTDQIWPEIEIKGKDIINSTTSLFVIRSLLLPVYNQVEITLDILLVVT